MNNDGVCDSADLGQIAAAKGVQIGQSGYRAELDLDADGDIDPSDWSLADADTLLPPVAPGLVSDPAGADSPVGFCGYVYSPEAGLYAVRYRAYDPTLGRFVQSDPAGYVDGMNLFEYTGGMPLTYTDPSGLSWNPLTWGLGGADEGTIDAYKDKHCDSLKQDRDSGDLSQKCFEMLWANGGCGTSTGDAISDAALAGAGQGIDDALILAADHIVWGMDTDLHNLANQVRAENDGVWGYAAGDIALNLSMKLFETALVMAASQAVNHYALSQLPTWHYTTAAGAEGIATTGVINASSNGLVYTTIIPPSMMPYASTLIGLMPQSVPWAVRVHGTSGHWVPWVRTIFGPYAL